MMGWELGEEGMGARRRRGESWVTLGWEKNSLGRKLTLYGGRTGCGRWERVPPPIHSLISLNSLLVWFHNFFGTALHLTISTLSNYIYIGLSF